MNADHDRLDGITRQIIGCAYTVGNALGCGFLEKVYENALFHELSKQGLQVEQQRRIEVRYDGIVVGEFAADLFVEESVIVELKATKDFDEIHMAQCLNYLNASNLSICLLINFGTPRVKVKRVVNKF